MTRRLDRRQFLGRVAGWTAGVFGAACARAGLLQDGTAPPRDADAQDAGAQDAKPAAAPATPATPTTAAKLPPSPLPMRRLGRTDAMVTVLGLGGHHVGLTGSESAARRMVDAALEAGIRFFDTAESYQGGNSERWMGAALAEVRDEVFLMSKTHEPGKRDAAWAQKHLEGSLQRLGTDRLDLWQLHSVKSPEDVDNAFREGGAMEFILSQREAGVVKHVGVTGHIHPAAHLRALHWWDQGWRFDTMQFPLNPIDHHQRSFAKALLPELAKRDIGVIAMKTSASGALMKEGVCSAEECLRYVLSLPIHVAVVGMERPALVEINARTVREAGPLDAAESEALLARIAPRADLSLEWYKRA
ncbi:MAG: aldo/keto reductase [Planctomycetota bacterium]|jgi:predicted aldo/keto reductase-like oxidoreductase